MPEDKPTASETPTESAIENTVTTVGQPAEAATTRAMTTPMTTPERPPIEEISEASMTNWLRTSLRGAPTARRDADLAGALETLASMMFMMPMPPTSSEMPAMQPITRNSPGAPALLEELLGDDDLVVVGAGMQTVEERLDDLGRLAQETPGRTRTTISSSDSRIALELAHRGGEGQQDLLGRRADRHALN